jgi:hypothetical protein
MKAVDKAFSQWASLVPHKRPQLSIIRICAGSSYANYPKLPVFRIDVESRETEEREVAFQYYWFLRWGMGYRHGVRKRLCLESPVASTMIWRQGDGCEVVVDNRGVPLAGWLVSTHGASSFQHRARRAIIRRVGASGCHLHLKGVAARHRHGQFFLPSHLRNDMWLATPTSADAWDSNVSYSAARDGLSLCNSRVLEIAEVGTAKHVIFPMYSFMAAATTVRFRGLPTQIHTKLVDQGVAALSLRRLSWMELLATSQSLSSMMLGQRLAENAQADRAAKKFVEIIEVGGTAIDTVLWERIAIQRGRDLPSRIVVLMRGNKNIADLDSLSTEASARIATLLRLLQEEVHYINAQHLLCEVLLLINFLWRFQANENAQLRDFISVSKVVIEACNRIVATSTSSREEKRANVGNPREVASVNDVSESRAPMSETSCVEQSGILQSAPLRSTSLLSNWSENDIDVTLQALPDSHVAIPYCRSRCDFLIGDSPDHDLRHYALTQLSASVSLMMGRRTEPGALELTSRLQLVLKTSLWEHYCRFGFFCQSPRAPDNFFLDLCWLNVPSAAICAVAPRRLSDTATIVCLEFGDERRLSPMASEIMSLFYKNLSAAFSEISCPIKLSLTFASAPLRRVAPPSGILDAVDVLLPWIDEQYHSTLRRNFEGVSIGMQAADRLHDTLQLLATSKQRNGVVAKALRASICQSIGFIVRKQRISVVITSAEDVQECFHRELQSSRGRSKK